MRTKLIVAMVVGVLLTGWFLRVERHSAVTQAQDKSGPNLAHMVFFTLKDKSADAQKKLIDSAYKNLKGHDGEVYFSCGSIVEDLKRPVNDRDFQVGLHIVFKDLKAHDTYQTHPRHEKFIEEGKHNWEKVRVFDSYVK